MNKLIGLLGSGPLVALAGHAITAGLTYALSKGYVTPEALSGVVTVGGLVLNAAASAGRSTLPAAVHKIAGSPGLAVVSSDAMYSNDRTARD